ncbi:MAG: TIGR03792 family protein [Ilumatobacter sp.]|nr:TIGR03792 family protein [bacterium]MDG1264953.1 TIGR03792 family protein [Ilumatobacter sp.]MDG2039012.1 TIGR03792 family protein [Ilumatobacter sp.]NKB40789.1 TIGR03792 family protein [Ilumatobacter sp.]
MSADFRYSSDERLPVEVLVFEVDPEHVGAFLAVDHEVWTLGEADVMGLDHIPFLSKEVWLDDAHPGRIILTFVWESIESWQHVGDEQRQRELQARFDERFQHRVTLLRALHDESNLGIHRVSRFERLETQQHL